MRCIINTDQNTFLCKTTLFANDFICTNWQLLKQKCLIKQNWKNYGGVAKHHFLLANNLKTLHKLNTIKIVCSLEWVGNG